MRIAGVREAPLSDKYVSILRLIGDVSPVEIQAPVDAALGPLPAACKINEPEPVLGPAREPLSIAEPSISGFRPTAKRARLDEGIIHLTENSKPIFDQATSKYNNIIFKF